MSVPPNGHPNKIGFPQAFSAAPYQPTPAFHQFTQPPISNGSVQGSVQAVFPPQPSPASYRNPTVPPPQPFVPPPAVKPFPSNPPNVFPSNPLQVPPPGENTQQRPPIHSSVPQSINQSFDNMHIRNGAMPSQPSLPPFSIPPQGVPPPTSFPSAPIPQPGPPTMTPSGFPPGPPQQRLASSQSGYPPRPASPPIQNGVPSPYPQQGYPVPSSVPSSGPPVPPAHLHQPLNAHGYPAPMYPGANYNPNSLSDFFDLTVEKNPMLGGISDVEYNLPDNMVGYRVRCDPAVFRCTLNTVPQTDELLQKSRLPFGITLQPFRDSKHLNVIRAPTIVRCRYCRAYINPFVFLPDNRHWKCNICYKSNDLPEDFCYDSTSKTFMEPSNRPELQNATVEFIAPNEYTLRPPQQAVYVFILDVSSAAIESGYLEAVCEQLLVNLDQMPGDDRTLVAFVGVDSSLHFFHFPGKGRRAREMVVDDIEEAFLPANNGVLVNLKENKESIRQLIGRLPEMFSIPCSSSNCMGAALQVVYELMTELGGRVTVFLASLPDVGPGALKPRENPNDRAGKEADVCPATDFYKRLALECTAHQVAIDLFLFHNSFVDVATLSEMSKFSSGSVYSFAGFNLDENPRLTKRLQKTLTRYLTRKIGFEAVLRIRCSRGLTLSSFFGHFFVRSTDLLALANVSPDSAMGVLVSVEERISAPSVCFQAALLYTSSKGDRRIRVHTLCLPTSSELSPIYNSLDAKCCVSLLAKMGVERATAGSRLADCRDALMNAAVDGLGSFARSAGRGGLLCPSNSHLKFLPIYTLGLVKHRAFSSGRSVRVDDRVAAMIALRSYPLEHILSEIYPMLYRLNDVQTSEPRPLPLSFESISREGVYLMVVGDTPMVYVAASSDPSFVSALFGRNYQQLDMESFREMDNEVSRAVHAFVSNILHQLHVLGVVTVVREDCSLRHSFIANLIDDRTESSHSYVEYINHIRRELGR